MLIFQHPSPNYSDRSSLIDMIVLHYTDMENAASAIARLCDPQYNVSAHYVVGKDGAIYQLVDEENKAYHAGVSFWDARSSLNDYSIGIELDNPGLQYGLAPFPGPQMDALVDLIRDIRTRHRIPDRLIVGHSDIAPTRKADPGPLFDWSFLGANGIGIWPDFQQSFELADVGIDRIYHALGCIGYKISHEEMPLIIRAFQLRFYPEQVTGVLDSETIRRILIAEKSFSV